MARFPIRHAEMQDPSEALNLVLLLRRGATGIEDLTRISRYVRELDPDIHPVILRDRRHRLRRLWLACRPTFVFFPAPIWHFRPIRGAVVQGRGRAKSEELRALEARGVPVPRWKLESQVTPEELEDFGSYVVVKPNRGRRGADVRIKRRSRIKPGASVPLDEDRDRIIQGFVYTGRWPVSYRVTTLFGEVVWSIRIEAGHDRWPLEGREGFQEQGGLSIVSSGRRCTMSLNDDPEILELGERAHTAFPDVPVLGVDIVRDVETGRAYVLEVNSSGNVWTFSTKTGLSMQAQFGFDLEQQFDGLRKAARILVNEARRQAR